MEGINERDHAAIGAGASAIVSDQVYLFRIIAGDGRIEFDQTLRHLLAINIQYFRDFIRIVPQSLMEPFQIHRWLGFFYRLLCSWDSLAGIGEEDLKDSCQLLLLDGFGDVI